MRLCDAVPDCPEADDEVDCTTCGPDDFQCDSGQCIAAEFQCDSYLDCFDNSDELRCGKLLNTSTRDVTNMNDVTKNRHLVTDCQANQTRCSNGQCVLTSSVCDGNHDCVDFSDETVSITPNQTFLGLLS